MCLEPITLTARKIEQGGSEDQSRKAVGLGKMPEIEQGGSEDQSRKLNGSAPVATSVSSVPPCLTFPSEWRRVSRIDLPSSLTY